LRYRFNKVNNVTLGFFKNKNNIFSSALLRSQRGSASGLTLRTASLRSQIGSLGDCFAALLGRFGLRPHRWDCFAALADWFGLWPHLWDCFAPLADGFGLRPHHWNWYFPDLTIF